MKITLFIWRVRTRFIPIAFLRMALDHLYLRRVKGLTFYKLLGTGKGETFTPRDADLWQWGLLVVGDIEALSQVKASALIRRWNSNSTESAVIDLQTLASHGQWSKQEPFENIAGDIPTVKLQSAGSVAAITRARITWRKNLIFWRAVPPVIETLSASDGLIAAIGIGEAPLGLQGTFSIWRDSESLRNFAYKSQAHRTVIEKTREIGWYSEELFARFAVISATGSLNGIALSGTAD